MLFFLAAAVAFLASSALNFETLHAETSLPVFGSVCPNKDEFVLTLQNGTTVIYTAGKRTFVPTEGYASLCAFDGIIGLKHSGNGTTTDRVKNLYIPGHIYWFAWGINRFGAADTILVANRSLLRNNVEIQPVEQVYGCAASFYQYPRVTCNSDAHSSITYLPGLHTFGHHLLRTYASYDESPSFSTMNNEVVESNLPNTLSYIRYYANADSAVYAVYLDDGVYNVAKLQFR